MLPYLSPTPPKPNDEIVGFILGFVVVGGLAFGTYKVTQHFGKARANAASSRATQGPTDANGNWNAAWYAAQIRQAFNPSGNNWMIGMDGTDEDRLFQLARGILNLSSVAAEYNTMYGANLADDLSAELSTEEQQRFYDAIPK